MRSLCAILSSLLILFQSLNISFNDLSKLDELIEHAKFHKVEYGDSFITFLSKHYGELKEDHHEKHQEEQNDHEQLPFQCHDYTSVSTVFVIYECTYDSETIEINATQEVNFHYLDSFSSIYKKGLLQPPKYS